jgi:hypothetical protein
MVGAMLVLLLVVAAFVLFRDLNRNQPENPVEALEYLTVAEYAREEADFALVSPEALPEGWIATSVRFDRTGRQLWHLGILTDEERYVGLEQSPRSVARMVEQFVDEDATEGDQVTVDGEVWRTFTDEGGDLALVRRAQDSTVLVLGRVPRATLEELVARLR